MGNKEMQKEIQSLKRKTLYLTVAIISLVFSWIATSQSVIRRYATIQDYYFETLEAHRDLNDILADLTPKIEEVLEENR